MVQRALLALIGGAIFWQNAIFGFAEQASGGTAEIVIPPAPAVTPEGDSVPPPEPNEPTHEKESDGTPTLKPLPADSAPMPVPEEEGPILVPTPDLGTEVIIEEGGTLRSNSGTGTEGEELSDPLDFSAARWRPGKGGMMWMPGHRDRFGIFSLTGESLSLWEDWGGLASTFGHGFHFLNGPVRSDLPSKLFDLSWGLAWNRDLTDGWSASLAAKVGLYTDFEDSVRDGWRFPAHAVVFHDWNETVQGALGVNFLDRQNLPALPVVGLIFRPDERLRLEAIFPEPRIAWRVHAEESSEHWLSLSGQIGGGEWAIERANTDLADVVTYNDYSVVLGFHGYTPRAPTTGSVFEIGYTFARDLEYRSNVGNFEPGETLFFRLSHGY